VANGTGDLNPQDVFADKADIRTIEGYPSKKRQIGTPSGQSPSVAHSALDVAQRDAVRRATKDASNAAAEMLECAKDKDPIGLSVAGFDLVRKLGELWSLRANRDCNWRDLVNLLQLTLAQEDFEIYTPDKCAGLLRVLSDHLRCGTIETDDVGTSIRILEESGFDPWKAISGEPRC
jgi:hypothetical protein